MAGIRLESLSKTYQLDDMRQKQALSQVTLEVADGEFVCLLGPSGCGKSTLLNIMSGLDQAYEGELAFTLNGVQKEQPPERLSYMFQEPRLLPWLSVRENLRFVLDDAKMSTQIGPWLRRVGLASFEDYYPGQLSTGMQQRVAVARALILEPDVLFMDEPFSSLDELTALKMRRELLELWQERTCTVVFVTHNPLEAVFLADRVVMMSASPGRIISELRVNEHLPRPRDPEDSALWELSRLAVRKLTGELARPKAAFSA